MHKYFLVIAQNKWFVNRLWNWNFNPVFDNVHKKLVPAHYTVTSNVLTVTDENHRRCIFPILPVIFHSLNPIFYKKFKLISLTADLHWSWSGTSKSSTITSELQCLHAILLLGQSLFMCSSIAWVSINFPHCAQGTGLNLHCDICPWK